MAPARPCTGKITPQSLLRIRSVSISGLDGRSTAALSSAWLERAPGPPVPGQPGAGVSRVPSLGGRRPLATPQRAPSELSLPQPSGLVHGVLRPSPHPAPSPVGSLVPEGLRRQCPSSRPLQGAVPAGTRSWGAWPASRAAPPPHGGAWLPMLLSPRRPAGPAAQPTILSQVQVRDPAANSRPTGGPGPRAAGGGLGAPGLGRVPSTGWDPCNLRPQAALPRALALGPGPRAIDPEGQTRVGPNPASATSQRFGPRGKSSGPLCAGVSVGEMGSVGVLPLAAVVTTAWDSGPGAQGGGGASPRHRHWLQTLHVQPPSRQ